MLFLRRFDTMKSSFVFFQMLIPWSSSSLDSSTLFTIAVLTAGDSGKINFEVVLALQTNPNRSNHCRHSRSRHYNERKVKNNIFLKK